MSIERWEARYACALGMAIYIHITRGTVWLTFFGIAMSMLYASMPAIQKWLDSHTRRDLL